MLVSIPLAIFLTKKPQEIRSRANTSTMLYFSPDTTNSNPLQKNINDPVSLEIMINPELNLVSFVRLQVKFDPTKLALIPANFFVPNINAFPIVVEGPVTTADTMAVSLSVGSDPTRAIQKTTLLGTINFKTIGTTDNTPTQVTFTNLTQALSAGPGDQASENILSTTTTANIAIINGTISPTITEIPTITPSGTPSATTTPFPTQVSTTLELDILLHGIGASGDNPNPKGSSLSNKNPLHPQRDISIVLIDSDNKELDSKASSINYDYAGGNFNGTIDLGPVFPSGNYNIKVKSGKYLRKLVPGIVNIKTLSKNPIPQTDLVAGDIKDDNVLNVLDYNILLDCGYGAINPLPIADPNSIYNSQFCVSHTDFRANTDLDDNGIINSFEYNLFLRELSVQNGD